MELPTVKVKWDNPQGFALINKDEYDENLGKYELYDAIPEVPESEVELSTDNQGDEIMPEFAQQLATEREKESPSPEPKRRKPRNPVETNIE